MLKFISIILCFSIFVEAGWWSSIGEATGRVTREAQNGTSRILYNSKEYYKNNKDRLKESAKKTWKKTKDTTNKVYKSSKDYVQNNKGQWKEEAKEEWGKTKKAASETKDGFVKGYEEAPKNK